MIALMMMIMRLCSKWRIMMRVMLHNYIKDTTANMTPNYDLTAAQLRAFKIIMSDHQLISMYKIIFGPSLQYVLTTFPFKRNYVS